MKRKSASTLIYFNEKVRRRSKKKRPKHINKEKRSKQVKYILLVCTVLVVWVLLVWFYAKYRPFDINNIEVYGVERFVNNNDVTKVAEEKSFGKNIMFFDNRDLENVIEGIFLASKNVGVRKSYPKSLKIEISERVPIALIFSGDSREFYFVDMDGFILGLADKSATNLPVINYSQKVEVGNFIEPGAVAYYFELIKALDDNGIFASTISSYPRYTEFYTSEDIQVLFTNNQNPRPQAKTFSKMLEAFKAEGKSPKKIDLRFDKVIVEFKN